MRPRLRMIQIAVCDDENYYQELVCRIIRSYMTEKGIEEYRLYTYSSGNEVISDIENLKSFQVLFMDISMADTDGITAAKEVRRVNEEICISFITSFIDYSLEGYKVNAIRYLLKDSLEQTLPECMDAILRKLKKNTEILDLTAGKERVKILICRILYIESRKHRIYIHYMTGKGINQDIQSIIFKLDDLEPRLPSPAFLRIHKSFLVNAGYICHINNYKAELTDGTVINISRDRY